MVRNIVATVLFVRDLAKCVTFYQDTLGLEAQETDPHKAKGVTFLKNPTDQPWGMRTAHFADPEGNIWEINHSIG
jgi:catechol 2,3-dioxygenase-like lactoylglutathione lyase family enzyme